MAHTLDRIDLDESQGELFKKASRLVSEAVDRSRAATVCLVAQGPTTGKELSRMKVSPKALGVFARVLSVMAKHRSFNLYPIHEHVATKEAAGILGVSRPYLISLLESEKIPYSRVGRHRRVLMKDVLEFAQRMRPARKRAIDEMVRLTEDNGAYELE